MTHSEAVEEMKVLADGRTWSLSYEVTSYDAVRIVGYIAPNHAEKAKTYAEAIENVKQMLGLIGCDPAPEDTDNA